jgi:glycosyltransferase involved in cell wall biosynthesis
MNVVLSNASGSWGGVTKVTEVLARGLLARGHEVVVFCRPASPLAERMRGVVPLEPVLKGMDLSPVALTRAAAALRRHRPDAAVMLMKKDVRLTGPAARLLGIPVVIRHANDQALEDNAYFRLLYGAIPAHHVTNARATRRTIMGSAPWLRADDVSVIYNGIDTAPFDAAEPANLGLPPGAVAMGFVGRFDVHKGVRDLAAAWPTVAGALPDAHLVVTGKGPLEDELRATLADASRVHFLGYRKDVPAVMKALDVLVLPSYTEGAPNVVQEAMAAGRAVVASAVSGTPELVDDGATGLLFPAGDRDALTRALLAVGGDAGLRARMGAAGRARVEREFTMDAMVDAYESLLGRLASAKKRR